MSRAALALPLFLAALLGAAGCGGGSKQTATTARPAAGITDLQSIDQFRKAFDAHRGVPRLIVLASPT